MARTVGAENLMKKPRHVIQKLRVVEYKEEFCNR